MALDSGLDFRSAHTRAVTNNSDNNLDTESLGKLVLRAMEDREYSMYCAYTIHPRIPEILYQPPNWVKAHITRQNSSKPHIRARILELSTSGPTVFAKLLDLKMLQQQQIQIIVNSKNEIDGNDLWTLAQLEVVLGKPSAQGAMKGTSSMSPSATSKSTIVDNSASALKLNVFDFMETPESPRLAYSDPTYLNSDDTESFLINPPEPVGPEPKPFETVSSDHEYRPKNHYENLGIPTDATAIAINEAFLSLYKRFHPKLNTTDLSADKRFVEITEAYEALRTTAQREAYDREHNFNQPPVEDNSVPTRVQHLVTFVETDSNPESQMHFQSRPRRRSLPQENRSKSPSRRFPEQRRASAYGDEIKPPSDKTTPLGSPFTSDWQEERELDSPRYQSNKSGGGGADLNGMYERYSSPAPLGTRSPPFLLSSIPLLQQSAVPMGRRPSYYPDHYDDRSYNPHALPGDEDASDDIVQQLLLEWTPAGKEAELAAQD
ncbi:hypothetical protein EYC80_002787 [Monilinia laxa]|uniref:J domain-containing protein n=1 Tax=Monilinia laxa TaxID=61186 RepID=A0A5N6KBN8_MONLA|nr:hypothetical protein EYC80_002787 [Monilinia laxa]